MYTDSGENMTTAFLKTIKVTPLAAESFGVRSMCTLVETPDVSVLLDAGVSLAPYRFNLPPHPVEFQTISRLRQRNRPSRRQSHSNHHQPLPLRSPHPQLRGLGCKLDRGRRNRPPNLHRQNRTRQEPQRKHQRQPTADALGCFRKQAANTPKPLKLQTAKPSASEKRSCVFLRRLLTALTNSGLGWVIMATR